MAKLRSHARFLMPILVGALLLLRPSGGRSAPDVTASASGEPARAAEKTVSPNGPEDPRELASFLDSFLAEQMAAYHIPGAAFVLVKDGSVFFSKGYGYADLATRQPVDPEQTLFNLGSVGKLFTATAVMQLAEQGRIELDDPVTAYVDDLILISDFSEPITVAQLLTHTAGFDERVHGAWVLDLEEVKSLGEYLRDNMPPVVLRPGDQISYSNHGYALAGYLVEQVSGKPFAQVVEDEILAPLAMKDTSLRQPLPETLTDQVATGYSYTDRYVEMPQVYSNFPPAGGQYATAADMARFMLAHLQNAPAADGDASILTAASVTEMQRRHTSGQPQLDGYAYAFAERKRGDLRAVLKEGDSPGYATLLFLLPEEDLGFFAAFNGNLGLLPVRDKLIEAFLDHYFAQPEAAVATPISMDLRRFAGSYRLNRFARTSIDKTLAPLQMIQLRITADDDGAITLNFPGMMQAAPSRWTPVAPLLFRKVEGAGYLAFREDDHGAITHLELNIAEPAVLERVPWLETAEFQLTFIGFLLFSLLSVLVWPLALLIRRWRGAGNSEVGGGRRARLLAGIMAALNLLFMASIGWIIVQAMTVGVTLVPGYLPMLLTIPFVTGALALVVATLAVRAWRRGEWSPLARLHYTLVALAGVAFIGFTFYWNLFGYKL